MKKLVWLVAGPLVLIVVLLVGGMLLLQSLLNAELMVQQIESNMNVRAEVEELNVSLLSIVSSVELRGVKLAPRDRYADAATPLAERPKLKGALIAARAFDLKFRLGPLLNRRFELQRLVLDQPEVNLVLYARGGNNLTSLFGPPKVVAGKRNPALDRKTEPKTEQPAAPEKSAGPTEPFSVRDLPIAARLDLIGLEDARINVLMQKTGQRIRMAPLTATVDSIDIDPEQLAQHNSLRVRFNMALSVLGRDGKESSRFLLTSGGRVVPFDAKTGYVNPRLTYGMTLGQGTFVDGYGLLNQLGGAFPLLEKAGIKLRGVGGRAELSRDTQLRIAYGGGRVTFLDAVTLPTKNYELVIEKGGWLQLGSNQHLLEGSLIASKEESARAVKSVDARLDKALAKAKDVNKEELKKQLLGPVLKDDRIRLPFVASGNIASPNVRLRVELPSLADLLKGQLGNLAKGKLKDALNKNPKARELMKKLPKLPF